MCRRVFAGHELADTIVNKSENNVVVKNIFVNGPDRNAGSNNNGFTAYFIEGSCIFLILFLLVSQI